MFASPLSHALTRFELDLRSGDGSKFPGIFANVLRLAPPQLRELSCAWGFAYELTREGEGWAVVATYAGSKGDRFHLLTDLLTALREQGGISRLTKLALKTPSYKPPPEELLRLRRAARGLM